MKDNCSICLELLLKDTTTTQCGHVFHSSCIEAWHRIKPTCPTCRFHNTPFIESYAVDHDDDDWVQYYFNGVEEVHDYMDKSDSDSE